MWIACAVWINFTNEVHGVKNWHAETMWWQKVQNVCYERKGCDRCKVSVQTRLEMLNSFLHFPRRVATGSHVTKMHVHDWSKLFSSQCNKNFLKNKCQNKFIHVWFCVFHLRVFSSSHLLESFHTNLIGKHNFLNWRFTITKLKFKNFMN